MDPRNELILIIDFGGHDSHVMARQVREMNVYSEIWPYTRAAADVVARKPKGVILASGSSGVRAAEAAKFDAALRDAGIPVLDFDSTHAPANHTALGRFVKETCGCTGHWTMASYAEAAVQAVRQQVQSGRAVCALSGGVDSSVAAVLVHRAIGDRLTCVYVDHGFMRKGETEQVLDTFRDRLGMNLIHIDARDRFLSKLTGVAEPEQKRKLIGEEFVRVFEEQAKLLGDAEYLVQGTVYPDVVESGTGASSVIKSHHNVGGLPDNMRLALVEPLRELYKDEVRQLGQVLGLPDEVLWRQPFPGPGLAIRVMGPLDPTRVAIVREADNIVVDEIRKAGLYRDVWQSFAVLTNTRSVGVSGDQRTYGYAVVVRAVTSTDAMTAQWYRLPPEVLENIASRIMREVPDVNRVVYDISSKPPATIEWE